MIKLVNVEAIMRDRIKIGSRVELAHQPLNQYETIWVEVSAWESGTWTGRVISSHDKTLVGQNISFKPQHVLSVRLQSEPL